MSSSRSVLRVWSLALALSAALAAAGERWPAPLPIQPATVWGLVLLPPLLMALVLLANWSVPQPDRCAGAADEAAAGLPTRQGGESDQLNREQG